MTAARTAPWKPATGASGNTIQHRSESTIRSPDRQKTGSAPGVDLAVLPTDVGDRVEVRDTRRMILKEALLATYPGSVSGASGLGSRITTVVSEARKAA
jgi:hypothetical protein